MNREPSPCTAYAPALSRGSPVATYQRISSSESGAIRTPETSMISRAGLPPRRRRTAVTTRCSRPPRSLSISAACVSSLGFPRIRPSRSTSVSAARIQESGRRAATQAALSAASRDAARSADSPGAISSAMSAGSISNGIRSDVRISARRGDEEARMRGTEELRAKPQSSILNPQPSISQESVRVIDISERGVRISGEGVQLGSRCGRGAGAGARGGQRHPARRTPPPVRRQAQVPSKRERRLGVVAGESPRLQRGGLDLHFDLAPLVLAAGAGRVVGEQVLAAQLLGNLAVDGFQVLRGSDVEGLPARHLCELIQLVLDVQLRARDLQADAVDRDAGPAHVLETRLEIELGSGVLAVGQDDERLLPLDPGELVEAVDDRVVEGCRALGAHPGEGAEEPVLPGGALGEQVRLRVAGDGERP